jgi:hypothetical protein
MLPTGYGLHAVKDYHALNMKTARYRGYCFAHIGYERAVTKNEKGKIIWKR